jgi:hypothetical protein
MFDERHLNASPSGPRALGLTALLLACLGSVALVPPAAAAPPRTLEPASEVEIQSPAQADALAVGGFAHALRTDDGRIQVMVELEDPSAAVVFADAMRGSLPSDPRARAAAGAASKAQVLKIEAAQELVAQALAAPAVDAREVFRVSKVMNAISVAIDPANLRNLQKIKGVKRVLPVLPEHPTGAQSVPFLGTPNVWGNTTTPPLPMGADGTGIRIGVIDTGIDYLHANFGGTGAIADYNTEKTNTASYTLAGSFPTAKIVGGTDFAGDAYIGSNAPVPDANPMDCNGHGSHVSGTAAGFGVTSAGATYAGAQGEALRVARLRLRRQHRLDRPGHQLGHGPERRQRPLRPPRRHQHVAGLGLRLGSQRHLGGFGQRRSRRRDRRHFGGQRRRYLLHRRCSRCRLADHLHGGVGRQR